MAGWLESVTGWSFITPAYFLFLLLAIAIFLFWATDLFLKLLFRPRRSKHSRYLLFGKDLIWLPCLLLSVLIAVALAGPEAKSGLVVSTGGQVDVIFAIDNSFSTSAEDLKPSRLELAKKETSLFLNGGVWQEGDRFTLFSFAKNSNWRMPLSEDVDELQARLAELTHPELYTDESQLTTDLSAVLEHIPTAMDKADDFYRSNGRSLGLRDSSASRIVFLFTDGDDQVKNILDKGLTELKKRNIKVYPVAVGTRAGRTIRVKVYNPPDYNYDDETGVSMDYRPAFEEEIMVHTALQTENLSRIAKFTGGEMFILNSEQTYLGNFMENVVNANRNASLRLVYSSRSRNIWWEVLAIPALIFLFFIVFLI